MKLKAKRNLLMAGACTAFLLGSGMKAWAVHAEIPGIAQQAKRQITGVVSDLTGEPVIGANVIEKGTTNGVITDIDGRFSLTVNNPEAVIEISFLGYATQEYKVGKQTSFKVILKEDAEVLDEVVVVGYGTMKKRVFFGGGFSD